MYKYSFYKYFKNDNIINIRPNLTGNLHWARPDDTGVVNWIRLTIPMNSNILVNKQVRTMNETKKKVKIHLKHQRKQKKIRKRYLDYIIFKTNSTYRYDRTTAAKFRKAKVWSSKGAWLVWVYCGIQKKSDISKLLTVLRYCRINRAKKGK